MRTLKDKKLYRILDANFNRAKEALRVCEDVCRFFLDQKKITAAYKKARHELTTQVKFLGIKELIAARNITGDVGRVSTKAELKRKAVGDIFYANSQRAKEAVRVLEEFAKLANAGAAQGLKRLRYKIYELERQVASKL